MRGNIEWRADRLEPRSGRGRGDGCAKVGLDGPYY